MTEPAGLSAWHNEATQVWWSYAQGEDELERAPEFLRPLLLGEVKRVEATPEQIEAALAWAAEVPGWEPLPADSKPLHVYRR